jgi:hypothetical protein
MYAHCNKSMNSQNNRYEPVAIVVYVVKKFAWKLLHFGPQTY